MNPNPIPTHGALVAHASRPLALPNVLQRLRGVPTRLYAATITFGTMLGVPAFFMLIGAAALVSHRSRPT